MRYNSATHFNWVPLQKFEFTTHYPPLILPSAIISANFLGFFNGGDMEPVPVLPASTSYDNKLGPFPEYSVTKRLVVF